MSVSNNGADERWSYRGGRAGDQTGTEWQVIPWYSYPWDVVLRYPDAKVRNWMGDQARKAAENNHIGYDQGQRQTFWEQLQKVEYDASKITVDCESDCSAGVLAIAKAAGYHFDVQKLKDINQNGYTGNEEAILVNAGFVVLRDRKYLTSDKYLDNGDIMLNTLNHTAFNITRGTNCDADEVVTPTQNLFVIDVSEHQGKIDWNRVKSHIDGAIIRTGYGDDDKSQDDKWWAYNVSEVERLGIPYGVYHYSYAASEAQIQSEINHVLRLLKGHNPVIGVYIDLEEPGLQYMAERTATKFCEKIRKAGYKDGIYCGQYYSSAIPSLVDKLKTQWWIPSYPPEWADNGTVQLEYKPKYACVGWQYSSKGYVDGISTNLDMNQWYVPFDGVKPTPTPEPTPTKKVPHISYEVRNIYGIKASGKDGSEASLQNAIVGIKIGVDIGKVEYRVHCNGRWLPKVTGNDWNDFNNGYAGDDVNPIDAIQIYYTSDTGKTEYYEAVYAVKPFGLDWLPEICDTNWEASDGNNTAGIFGYSIGAVRIKLSKC